MTLVYVVQNPGTGTLHLWKWEGIAPAIGSMAFLFLSAEAILPMSQSLHKDLARPHRFENLTIVAYAVITVANMVFGWFLS